MSSGRMYSMASSKVTMPSITLSVADHGKRQQIVAGHDVGDLLPGRGGHNSDDLAEHDVRYGLLRVGQQQVP